MKAPKIEPIQIVVPTPAVTMKRENKKLFLSKSTVETISPWIGIIRGATITVHEEKERETFDTKDMCTNTV
jgi:hypothetical protein